MKYKNIISAAVNKGTNIIFTIVIFVIFLSCAPLTDKEPELLSINIDLNKSKNHQRDLASEWLGDNVRYLVPDDSSLIIGRVNKLISVGNYFYIFDDTRNQEKILKLNAVSGEVIYELKNKGRGPGEFSAIMDFDVDSTNSLLVLYDRALKKVLYYSALDGEFQSEYEVGPGYFIRVAVFDKKSILFTDYPDYDNEYFIHIYNDKGEKIRQEFPIPYEYTSSLPFGLRKYFSKSFHKDETPTFVNVSDNVIYGFTQDLNVIERYSINYGKEHTLPESRNILSAQDMKIALGEGYALLKQDFMESQNYIYYIYLYGGMNPRLMIYSKNTGKTKSFIKGRNDIDGFPQRFVGIKGDSLIAHVTPNWLDKYNPQGSSKIDLNKLKFLNNNNLDLFCIYPIKNF